MQIHTIHPEARRFLPPGAYIYAGGGITLNALRWVARAAGDAFVVAQAGPSLVFLVERAAWEAVEGDIRLWEGGQA
jgi:hypothetical protein